MKLTDTRIFQKLYPLVMGQHPNNKIFAFNFHNVRHIVRFLTNVSSIHLPNSYDILVDVGAGHSPYYSIFSPKVNRYIAVDAPGTMPQGDQRKIEQIEAFAEKLPLTDESADIVLSNQVLEHVEDPLQVLKEAMRILKPGGVFIGSVPHVSPIHLEPYDFWRFTEFGLSNLFKKVGFNEFHIEGNGGVHKAAALMITMDWMLSKRTQGEAQRFHPGRALALSPIIALINGFAIVMDKLVGDKSRTPANLCWVAIKPSRSLN